MKLFQEWEKRHKENDGGGEFNYDTLLRTLINVMIYPSTTIVKMK
jgi:hypothetical protein